MLFDKTDLSNHEKAKVASPTPGMVRGEKEKCTENQGTPLFPSTNGMTLTELQPVSRKRLCIPTRQAPHSAGGKTEAGDRVIILKITKKGSLELRFTVILAPA